MAVLLLLVPGSAFAAGWTGLQSVPPANSRTIDPPVAQIGLDAAGNTTLAMLVDKGPPQFVQVADRPAGGNWSAAQELGPVPSATGVPSLAVDKAGNALLAWADSSAVAPCTGAPNGCLHVLAKPAGSSTWTTQTTRNSALAFIRPAVALGDGTGVGAVVWSNAPTAGVSAVQGISGTVGGAWGSVQTPTPGGSSELPGQLRVAIDGSGRPVAIWSTTQQNGACPCSVRSSVGFAAQGFLVPATTLAVLSPIFLARNAQGSLDSLWVTSDPTNQTRAIRTAQLDPGSAAWGTSSAVYSTTTSHAIAGPRIVTAADGESVAAWTDDLTGVTSVRGVLAAVRPAGGTWSGSVALDANTVDPNAPALTLDGAGNATAVWHNGATASLRYALHPHGGSFGETLAGPATPAGQLPIVAETDPAGHVHAAWASASNNVDTAVFDPVAPSATALPASAAASAPGIAMPFEITANDVWSNPVSVHWDFGDGQSADGAAASHAYATPGVYVARAIATDSSGNANTQTETIAVAAAPGTPLRRPVAGKTVNLEPVGGVVLVKVPGSNTYVPLVSPTQVQNGSIIDARKGRVRITIDNGRGGLDTAEFFEGIFKFTQPKVKAGALWFANLYLFGGSFKGCPAAPKNPQIAQLSAAKRKSPNRSVRHLWGSGKGAFRTVGRFSSATVRGTTWLTDDRCNATLTKVTTGKVGVRDFVLKKTIILTARKQYLAKPTAKPAARSKKR